MCLVLSVGWLGCAGIVGQSMVCFLLTGWVATQTAEFCRIHGYSSIWICNGTMGLQRSDKFLL